MSTRPFPSLRLQRLLHAFLFLSLLLSPLQSIAAYIPRPADRADPADLNEHITVDLQVAGSHLLL